jgi:molecular chaperone HtpG
MHSFVDAARKRGYDVLDCSGQLDGHFIGWFEHKNPNTRFVRVDSDVVDKLIQKEEQQSMALSSSQQELMRPVFEAQLPEDGKVHYNIEFEAMAPTDDPVVITRNEYMRRMKDMVAMGGGGMGQFYGQMPDNFTIAVNGNHPLVIDILGQVEKSYGDKLESINKKIDAAQKAETTLADELKGKKDEELTDDQCAERDTLTQKVADLRSQRTGRLREIGSENQLVGQLVDLALLSNGLLKGEELTNFIRRSVELIGK